MMDWVWFIASILLILIILCVWGLFTNYWLSKSLANHVRSSMLSKYGIDIESEQLNDKNKEIFIDYFSTERFENRLANFFGFLCKLKFWIMAFISLLIVGWIFYQSVHYNDPRTLLLWVYLLIEEAFSLISGVVFIAISILLTNRYPGAPKEVMKNINAYTDSIKMHLEE